jgi:hypothetical protein
METLFTTSIIINGQQQAYAVTFQDDAYQFTPDDNTGPNFGLRRAEDEWKLDGDLTPIAKDQAVSALEHYLLSQH